MKTIATFAGLACLVSLAACGDNQTKAENTADAIEAAAENRADAIDNMAANASTMSPADNLANQADQVREAGENRADAVREGAEHNGMGNHN